MTNEYSKIIKALEAIEGLEGDQAAAVAEACDIISDYDAACQSAARMTARYETPALAIKKGDFGYCCPTCGRWIRVPDSWCHWCGQRIEWDAIARDRYKEERNQRRTQWKDKDNR